MKKYLVPLAMMTFMAACGGGSDTANNEDTSAAATTDENAASGSTNISDNPDYQAGLDLIGKSDCLTCHKTTEKLVGPAYVEVAKKYSGSDTAVQYLAGKIIHGGSGVWGDVAMTPHANLSQADAEQMAQYILLLKDQ